LTFEYNRIPVRRVSDVEVVPISNEGYQDLLDDVVGGKNESKKEREEIVERNRSIVNKFSRKAEEFVDYQCGTKTNAKHIHSLALDWMEDSERVCGDCRYSKNDDYRNGEDKLVCWENRPEQKGNRPRKITADSDFAEQCESFSTSLSYSDDAPDVVTENITVRNLMIRIEKAKEGDKKELRKVALRLAWYLSGMTEVDGDWNYKRAEAFLRDIGSPSRKTSNKSGSGGVKFENKVRARFDDAGLPDKDRVLKIELDNGKRKYKEMDLHTEIAGDPYIIEIFTQRSISKKEEQVRNYAELYEIAKGVEPETLLLTDESFRELISLNTFEGLVDTKNNSSSESSTLSEF
jgi:hypothetical protein